MTANGGVTASTARRYQGMSDKYLAAVEEIRESKRVLLTFSDDQSSCANTGGLVQGGLRLVKVMEEDAAMMEGRMDLLPPEVEERFLDCARVIHIARSSQQDEVCGLRGDPDEGRPA